MDLGNTFYEFALLLTAAGTLGFVAQWLTQPLIRLKEAGSDLVLLPFREAADEAADVLLS